MTVLRGRLNSTSSIRKMALTLAVCCAPLIGLTQAGQAKADQSARWVLRYNEALLAAQQHAGSKRDIRNDPRFLALLKASFRDQPDIWKFVTQPWQISSSGVTLIGERYAVMTGCPRHECGSQNWLLWIDAQSDSSDVFYASLACIGNDQNDEGAKYSLGIVGGEPHRKTISLATLPKGFWKTLQEWFSDTSPFDDGFFAGYDKRRIVAASFDGPNHTSIPLPAGSLRRFNLSDSSSN